MNIAILGYGVVGKGVDTIISRSLPEFSVTRILDLPDRLTDDRMTCRKEDIFNDDSIELVVECMGGTEPARSYILEALEKGKSVVSSNKAVLAAYFGEFMEAARFSGGTLAFEAAVCGGIPWLCSITDILRTDSISAFRGIMNGSTNYILTAMERSGADFADALREAQDLGYAERNTRDDIEGIDVKNKTIITANVAFNTICTPDFPVEGIGWVTREDLELAAERSYRVKLLSRGVRKGDAYALSVEPAWVSTSLIEAHVGTNFNCAVVDASYAGKLMFYGQGAGSLPTAHAIVQDILDYAAHNGRFIRDYSVALSYDPALLRSDYIAVSSVVPIGAAPYGNGLWRLHDLSAQEAAELSLKLRDEDPTAHLFALLQG